MSSDGIALRTYPQAPAAIASATKSSSSNVVTTRTRIAGKRAVISRVASMPSISGIRRSIKTTSGRSLSACAIASRPSVASPSETSRDRRPSGRLSRSAVLQRDDEPDHRAGSRSAANRKRRPDRGCPLAHDLQPMSRGYDVRIETDSVVLDDQLDGLIPQRQQDRGRCGLGVPRDVRQGLASDALDVRDDHRIADRDLPDPARDLDVQGPREIFAQAGQRRREVVTRERLFTEARNRSPQRRERFGCDRPRPRDRSVGLVRSDGPQLLRALELNAQGRQTVADLVVEISGDAETLGQGRDFLALPCAGAQLGVRARQRGLRVPQVVCKDDQEDDEDREAQHQRRCRADERPLLAILSGIVRFADDDEGDEGTERERPPVAGQELEAARYQKDGERTGERRRGAEHHEESGRKREMDRRTALAGGSKQAQHAECRDQHAGHEPPVQRERPGDPRICELRRNEHRDLEDSEPRYLHNDFTTRSTVVAARMTFVIHTRLASHRSGLLYSNHYPKTRRRMQPRGFRLGSARRASVTAQSATRLQLAAPYSGERSKNSA